MLDRNFLLSLALAFLLIFVYNAYYQMRFGPHLDQVAKEMTLAKEKKKNEAKKLKQAPMAKTGETAEPASSAPAQQAPEAPAAVAASAEPDIAEVAPAMEEQSTEAERIIIDTGTATVTLSTRGALITSYKLNGYHDAKGTPVELIMDPMAFEMKQKAEYAKAKQKGDEADFVMVPVYPTTGLKFPKEEFSRKINSAIFSTDASARRITLNGGSAAIAFEYKDESGIITRKKYIFRPGDYQFDLSVQVESTQQWGDFKYSVVWFGLNDDEDENTRYLSYHRPMLRIGNLYSMDDPDEKKRSREYTGDIRWTALTHKYYAVIGKTTGGGDSLVRTSYIDKYNTTLEWERKSGQASSLSFFLGPKRHDILKKFPDGEKVIIDYGWFNIAAQPLFWLLDKLHSLSGNWGWAIMLLTLTVKSVLFPLSQKAFRSMKRLQKLQPQMKKLQELYKNDKEKMNQELMAFYKENKVNPMGGCLPMVLQIPIFFALYKVLYESIELKGVPWILWITDLTQKDPYYVTPLLMGATMFLQQWITPSTGDPTQRQIMLIMPVVFTFMFLSFPSGLILYWLVNNVLSIIQQWIINRESFEDGVPNAKSA
ncbi:MAG: membrane protein insertase YidC [Nitrospinota bacterium]|nr:membrane protein insertase YidC [Nitrospinota bacterium]